MGLFLYPGWVALMYTGVISCRAMRAIGSIMLYGGVLFFYKVVCELLQSILPFLLCSEFNVIFRINLFLPR